jgi:nucleotide-binding universal stress UspA family protein
MNKKILVPTDFTKVAHVALEHAAKTAEVTDSDIILLHVVKSASEVDGAKPKLEEEAEIIRKSDTKVKVECVVRIGNIFDDIGDTAAELDAELIFMGTHGASGWQKIVGSHAMKVITHSEVPFVVVQERGIRDTGYDDIVVPLDLHKETKQKLEIVAQMAKYFEGRVHIITPKETDEFLKNQLERNIYFAKNYLGEREIEFTTTVAETSSFDDAIVEHASAINADLITIMNLAKNSLMGMGLLGSKYEQELITNKHGIPVMIVNPRETGVFGGSVFTN